MNDFNKMPEPKFKVGQVVRYSFNIQKLDDLFGDSTKRYEGWLKDDESFVGIISSISIHPSHYDTSESYNYAIYFTIPIDVSQGVPEFMLSEYIPTSVDISSEIANIKASVLMLFEKAKAYNNKIRLLNAKFDS